MRAKLPDGRSLRKRYLLTRLFPICLILLVVPLAWRNCSSSPTFISKPVYISTSDPQLHAEIADKLKAESPVIPIGSWLEACTVNEISGNFHESVVVRGVVEKNPPLSPREFVCRAQCQAFEPELEKSLRYLGGSTTKYTAASISQLCRFERVPLLVKIQKGRAYWAKCMPGRVRGSHLWFAVRRMLYVLPRLVNLEDVVFAFDNSDFSRPTQEDHHGLSWNFVLPGVVRFVGDAAHPSLLWPTHPYVTTTAYCRIDHDDIDGPMSFGWLQESKCEKHQEVTWSAKDDKVFWRGSPTGVPIDDDHVTFMPRSMLNLKFSNQPGYDVAFIDGAVPPYANERFKKSHLWKKSVSRVDFGKNKMIISLDGHTAAWGLVERLAIGSLLLVHESLRGYREFYYMLLKPYEHYIPVAFDFSNLEKIRQWVLTKDGDAAAQKIVKQAGELIKTRMRPADMWCYLYRMLATLAQKQGFQTDDIEFSKFQWMEITDQSIRKYEKPKD